MNLLKAFSMPNSRVSDFFSSDGFALDDEVVADLAISAMLMIMNNGVRSADYRPGDLKIHDYAPLVSYGVRFPWKGRVAFGKHVDLMNDELPRCAVIGRTRVSKGLLAEAVYATEYLQKAPRALNGAKGIYRTGYIQGYNHLSKQVAPDSKGEIESVAHAGFAAYFPDGVVIGCDSRGNYDPWFAELFSYVIGLHNDKKYFWNVTASEEFWDDLPAKAHFSIDQEYVKSLFYARSLPYTDKGRLRPILHWVSSHKRRIKEGIDIDVKKYLRGISTFSMHGLNFEITEPVKKQDK
jgi:hypothetical protein